MNVDLSMSVMDPCFGGGYFIMLVPFVLVKALSPNVFDFTFQREDFLPMNED